MPFFFFFPSAANPTSRPGPVSSFRPFSPIHRPLASLVKLSITLSLKFGRNTLEISSLTLISSSVRQEVMTFFLLLLCPWNQAQTLALPRLPITWFSSPPSHISPGSYPATQPSTDTIPQASHSHFGLWVVLCSPGLQALPLFVDKSSSFFLVRPKSHHLSHEPFLLMPEPPLISPFSKFL